MRARQALMLHSIWSSLKSIRMARWVIMVQFNFSAMYVDFVLLQPTMGDKLGLAITPIVYNATASSS